MNLDTIHMLPNTSSLVGVYWSFELGKWMVMSLDKFLSSEMTICPSN